MAPIISASLVACTAAAPRRRWPAVAIVLGWGAGLAGAASGQTLVLPDGPVLTTADTVLQVLFGGYVTASSQEEASEPLIMLSAWEREHWLRRKLVPCAGRYCKPKLGNVDMFPTPTSASTDFAIGDPIVVDYRFSLPPGATADLSLQFQVEFGDPTRVGDWNLRILDNAGSAVGPSGTANAQASSSYAFGRSAGAYTLRFSASSFGMTNFTITGSPVAVPEPPVIALWAIGGLLLLARAASASRLKRRTAA
jgi:hypothetical protein